jgi:phospholipid transport system substrate-binding protein
VDSAAASWPEPAILRDPDLRPAGARQRRIAQLRRVADGVFDWTEMSRRSLGHRWRQLDDSQRQAFANLLPDVLAGAYLDDLDKFQGDERVLIENSALERERATVTTTLVTHSRERVPMVYWLHQVQGRWRVYDLSIEGVSLVNHYRESFNRFLVNHSVAELIARLETRR